MRAGQGAGDHLRPHRSRDGTLRLRVAVLVLLVLQPVQRPARGRLGGHADRVGREPRPRRRSTSRRRNRSSSSTPAASAPAGEHEGSEGGQPPDRVPGGRLARDVLRLGGVRARTVGHGSGLGCDNTTRAAARTAAAAGPAPGTCDRDRTLRLAELLRALGAEGEGLQQRADRSARRRGSGRSRSPGWTSSARTSPRMPGGSIVGPQVTSAFCGAVATASDVIKPQAKSLATALGADRTGDRDRAGGRVHPLGSGRPRRT